MVELEIDDTIIAIEEGAMIIEAADKAGIYIPRFCYHNKLSIAANCRMCLIEVVGVPKALPACATPVTPGMKVYTTSQTALAAQRSVMEFLLINHPLDCPICDQGGMCELQDLAMGFGDANSQYDEVKDAVVSPDIGPLIDTEMNRCICCTRCTRFGEEIAGLRELGVIERGEKSTISTQVSHIMQSEIAGNIIDLCPVGALNAKPSMYNIRGWEVKEYPAISPHDCVGSNLFVHSRGKDNYNERYVGSVVPRQCEPINEIWISDRDRFSYEGLNHKQRLMMPMMKKNGQWLEITWKRALVEIADKMQGLIQQRGADQLAGIISPNASVESAYLLQKMMRSLGSPHVDYRIREQDVSDQDNQLLAPSLGLPISEIQNQEAILLVGSNVRFEQPIISYRINKAYNNNAVVMAVNPVDYNFVYELRHKLIHQDIVDSLGAILKALQEREEIPVDKFLNHIEIDDQARSIAQQLAAATHSTLFLGAFAIEHPLSSIIRSLAQSIAKLSNSQLGCLPYGANAVGASLAGAVPHRGPAGIAVDKKGKSAHALLTDSPVRGYLLIDWEVELDSAYSESAIKQLKQAGLVVSVNSYQSESLFEYSDFILPAAPFSESEGTFVNIEGQWQFSYAASVPHGDSKPIWKILRALSTFLSLEDFDYETSAAVIDELKSIIADTPQATYDDFNLEYLPKQKEELVRLASWPCYRSDGLVRRAESLQKVYKDDIPIISLNSKTSQQLSLVEHRVVFAKQYDKEIELPWRIDDRLADNVVYIPSGFPETAAFGSATTTIQLRQEAL